MNINFMKKVLGWEDDGIAWDEETSHYKEHIERESVRQIPIEKILLLIGELNTHEKRQIARILQFSMINNKKKKFLDILFLKKFNLFLQECRKDNKHKRLLILALFHVLAPVMEEEEEFPSFIHRQNEKINEYGYWHYYWAFYLHPNKQQYMKLWEDELEKLDTRANEITNHLEKENLETNINLSDIGESEQAVIEELKRKIQLQEKKLNKEVEQRQKLEKELAQIVMNKKQKNRLIEQLQRQIGNLEIQLESQRKKQEELQLQGREEISNREKRNIKLKSENLKQITLLDKTSRELSEVELELETVQQLNERQKEEIVQLKREQTNQRAKKEQIVNKSFQVEDMFDFFYKEVNNMNQALLERTQMQSISLLDIRTKMKVCLTIIDLLEEFMGSGQRDIAQPQAVLIEQLTESQKDHEEEHEEHEEHEEQEEEEHDKQEDHDKQEEHNKQEEHDKQEEHKLGEAGLERFYGTFYRRDHGGYIILESGDTFNITESMVYDNGLQHEAEVECTPSSKKNGITLYTVKLLFQGDDDYSEVIQYDGYIELGAHNTLYCVDLNDPTIRFPLHGKDFMVLQPQVGAPCTFNMTKGGEYARISRFHKIYEDKRSIENKSNTEQNGKKESETRAKEKPAPFLEGCLITVVGGQKKWFEEVIRETGAELIHDDGSTPERIYSDLKRSHALFLLLTSNSHRATWGSIEIVKEHNIPHFTIQGSKSNFRQLLWENRELILSIKNNS